MKAALTITGGRRQLDTKVRRGPINIQQAQLGLFFPIWDVGDIPQRHVPSLEESHGGHSWT